MEKENRNQTIIRASYLGIGVNVVLAAFKAVLGMLSGSIAVTLDAINNLSDALGSVITVVATKLAAKPADRKHPFGYGRVEYLSTMLISGIVLYAGFTSLIESLKKVIHPEAAEYDMVTIILLVAAVGAKILLGTYIKKTGQRINADSLVMSGQEATLDAAVSALTIAAAGIFMVTGISLEAWVGAVIAVIIIKAGFEMLRDTISQLLGERVDKETAIAVKKFVGSIPGVHGAYDLVMNDYGPDEYLASIHVAVSDTMTAVEIDRLTRRIMDEVYQEFHIVIAAVGIYSVNTMDPHLDEVQKKVSGLVLGNPDVLAMHGFYIDEVKKFMSLDIVISFKARDAEAIFAETNQKLKDEFPGYTILVQRDLDMS